MSDMDVHYSSKDMEHWTPPSIIRRVVACLGAIDVDPCSNRGTPHVPAATHYTYLDDGLGHPWHGRIYMNPPYGRVIDQWVVKLVDEHRAGRVTDAIALVPARTDTQWFYRLRDGVCCFVRRRLRFVGNTDDAPFPSVLVYLGPDIAKFGRHFADLGDLWQRLPDVGVRVSDPAPVTGLFDHDEADDPIPF